MESSQILSSVSKPCIPLASCHGYFSGVANFNIILLFVNVFHEICNIILYRFTVNIFEIVDTFR